MSYNYRSEPSAPSLRTTSDDDYPPIPPVRADIQQHPQREVLLPPPRADIPSSHSHTTSGLNRADNERNAANADVSGTCNLNRYATTKTIGQALLALALLMSNIVQLRALILQKQHDTIWTVSLVLVCLSILCYFGLGAVLYIVSKGDITNPSKEERLERFNKLSLLIIVLLTILNIGINVLMLTVNPKAFLDTRSLELLQTQTQT